MSHQWDSLSLQSETTAIGRSIMLRYDLNFVVLSRAAWPQVITTSVVERA